MISAATLLLAALLPLLSIAHPYHPQLELKSTNTILGPQPLNLTTIAGNDRNESTIECWSVADLTVSDTPGTQGALFGKLGIPSAANYFVIPPHFDGGRHNAPAVQYVWFTSGEAIISLPTSNDTARIKGGASGLILVTDIASVSRQGHVTVYPSKTEQTIGLAVPLANNTLPDHIVLHAGACTTAEAA